MALFYRDGTSKAIEEKTRNVPGFFWYNMLEMSKYMLVLLFSGIIPCILSFWPGVRLYRNLPALAWSIAIVLVLFGGWDVYATWRGHWYFNPDCVWNFRVINLPLEEVLFFVVIPFCCIFTWEALQYIKRRIR